MKLSLLKVNKIHQKHWILSNFAEQIESSNFFFYLLNFFFTASAFSYFHEIFIHKFFYSNSTIIRIIHSFILLFPSSIRISDSLILSFYLFRCNPFFVRCIKPNINKTPLHFDDVVVLDQLRYTGVLQLIEIRKKGYPVRIKFPVFIHR